MITTADTALVLIDIQEKLARAMHNKEALFDNLKRMVKGARVLGLPILWAEQNPAGLGPTIREVAELLPDKKPVSKFSFSCCGNEPFMKDLKAVNCKNMLVAGIEAHVCVYQTVMGLITRGFDVWVIADAISSRTQKNYEFGLRAMEAEGAKITTVEMALFELLVAAGSDEFRKISRIIK